MKIFIKLFLLILLCVGVILIDSEKTSADLIAEKKQANNIISASTLSLASINTTSFDKVRWFFNIDGIKFNGHEVKPLIIKNEGKLDSNYSIKVIKNNSDDKLCESITLSVMKDWKNIYEGLLTDLNTNQKVLRGENDNLIFVVNMKQDADFLKEKQCNFDFEFKTWKNSPDEEEKGLFAKQVLSNSIKSGRW